MLLKLDSVGALIMDFAASHHHTAHQPSQAGKRAHAAEAFLLPGVFGDERQLSDLRVRLRGRLELQLVEMPGAGAPGAVLTDMAATAKVIVETIVQRRPQGAISLVGYSFGASAALEVAAQLTCSGHRIAFLGILDGPFTVDELPGQHAELRRVTATQGAVRAVVNLAGSVDKTRRMVLASSLPKVVGAERSEMVRRSVLTHLRNKALRGWIPPRCEARGVHVFTGDYGPSNRARWAELCPWLTPVAVAADHRELLTGHALETVATALGESASSLFQDR